MSLALAPRYRRMLEAGAPCGLARETPWPHFIVDDLIEPSAFAIARERILREAGDFELDSDPNLQIQLQYLADRELAEFFFSPVVRRFFEALSGSALRPNENLAIQMRRMTPESPAFPPHVDNVEYPSWAALYYVAPDWAPGNGGEVVLLEDETSDPGAPNSVWVEPIENRLLFFQTKESYWHAVRRVRAWERYVIVTEWIQR